MIIKLFLFAGCHVRALLLWIISSHNKVTASGETSILSNIFGNQASLFMGNKQDKILNFFSENSFQLIIIISKG